MMYALRRSVDKLLKYYEGLEPSSATHEHLHSSVFPSISPFHDKTGNTITFKYIRPLEDDPACITFHAKTTGSSPIDVVVKFVSSSLWSATGKTHIDSLLITTLAPQLLYCGSVGIQHDDPTFRGLRMVVMEYVDGQTLHDVERVPPGAKGEVDRALKILHNKDYVFGDLRRQNVMVTKNAEVKLVDFDWAGKENETRYPLLISKAITGPLGVEGGSLITRSRDIYMFSLL